jgi:hypothetical protein
MRHDLKCSSPEFRKMVEGVKNFDIRSTADRDFNVGDELIQHEVDFELRETGDTFTCKVMFILHGPKFGLPSKVCVMAVYGGFLTVPDKKMPFDVVAFKDFPEKKVTCDWDIIVPKTSEEMCGCGHKAISHLNSERLMYMGVGACKECDCDHFHK